MRLWPYAGGLALAILVGVFVWLWLRTPLLVNPYTVMDRLQAHTLDADLLPIMAVMLPVMMLICLFLLLALIAFGFAMMGRERQYLAIIDDAGIGANEQPAASA
ncbi:MAG: hypothetical protein ACYC7E_04965 [Armatimonadota bacterium]